MKKKSTTTRGRNEILRQTGIFQTSVFFNQSQNKTNQQHSPIGPQNTDEKQIPEKANSYNFKNNYHDDVEDHHVGNVPNYHYKIYDVKRLLPHLATVNSLNTVPNQVPTPPHELTEDPPQIHITKSNMVFTIKRQEKRQSRRIDKLQNRILNIMQTRILNRLDNIQSFNICNGGPIINEIDALHRQNGAMKMRQDIRSLFDLISSGQHYGQNAPKFMHFYATFETYKGMLYREEIRIDKMLDDVRDYLQYTNAHGIPPPPFTVPYSLQEHLADVTDTSSFDDDQSITASSPTNDNFDDNFDDDTPYTPTSPTSND